jgi:hypothetical protein
MACPGRFAGPRLFPPTPCLAAHAHPTADRGYRTALSKRRRAHCKTQTLDNSFSSKAQRASQQGQPSFSLLVNSPIVSTRQKVHQNVAIPRVREKRRFAFNCSNRRARRSGEPTQRPETLRWGVSGTRRTTFASFRGAERSRSRLPPKGSPEAPKYLYLMIRNQTSRTARLVL